MDFLKKLGQIELGLKGKNIEYSLDIGKENTAVFHITESLDEALSFYITDDAFIDIEYENELDEVVDDAYIALNEINLDLSYGRVTIDIDEDLIFFSYTNLILSDIPEQIVEMMELTLHEIYSILGSEPYANLIGEEYDTEF